MIIKNTETLRKRADFHHEQDQIIQGDYGEAKTNGDIEYKGCAIGCLSTPNPTEQPAFADFLKEHRPEGALPGKWAVVNLDSEQMREILGEEFGICYNLTHLAENIFESIMGEQEAADFVKEFAYALRDGIVIDNDRVNDFQEEKYWNKRSRRPWHAIKDDFLDWLKQGAPELNPA
jgi:hypothetical protein